MIVLTSSRPKKALFLCPYTYPFPNLSREEGSCTGNGNGNGNVYGEKTFRDEN